MSAKVRILALVTLAGVGSIEIPLLLHQTVGTHQTTGIQQSQGDQFKPQVPTPVSPILSADTVDGTPAETQLKPAEKKNCSIAINNISDTMRDILWDLGKQKDYYVSFQCDKTSASESGRLSGKWTGLIPKDLLVGHAWRLTDSDVTNIHTVTKSLGGKEYETIFQGEQFNGSFIEGKWDDSPAPTRYENYETITVTVKGQDDKSIYLVFEKESDNKD